MNCFIFSQSEPEFSNICGVSVLNDLATHLKNSGTDRIFTDSTAECSFAERIEYHSAKPLLGKDWIGAYEGIITRQSPGTLREKGISSGACTAISLASSSEPWKHQTVLTGEKGKITAMEKNPPPENCLTNLCFSGLVWVGGDQFDPALPGHSPGTSAFLLREYWNRPNDRENYLKTCYDILSGKVSPWTGETGIVLRSPLPESSSASGTFWLGYDCIIGENCKFENCVIMDGVKTGNNINLKNCLVNARSVIPSGTVREDKYLTLLGEQ